MNPGDIRSAYQYYLQREVDPEGMALYSNLQISITTLEYDLFNSAEYKKNNNILMYPQTEIGKKICILPEAKVVFVPIAKNAHTSITEAFLRFKGIDWKSLPITDPMTLEFGDEEHRFHAAIEENDTGILIKDLPPRIIHDALTSPEYLRVTVLRDPFKRLVSGYHHLLVQSATNPIIRKHAQSIWSFFGKTIDDNISFLEFLKYISCTPDSEIDLHFASQHSFISNFKIDKIIPMEKTTILEDIIQQRSGQPFKINHLNTHANTLKKGDIHVDDNIRRFINERYWIDNRLYQEALSECQ